MKKLMELTYELETKIPHSEKMNTAVSRSAVGWHIQHCVLVITQIIAAVEKSNPADYERKFNLNKMLVYTLNKIPRGKAKAPESVMPKETIDTAELSRQVALLKTRITVLNDLHPRSHFRHPYFGHLHLKDTIKMLKLHTKHHIRIIDDIIKG